MLKQSFLALLIANTGLAVVAPSHAQTVTASAPSEVPPAPPAPALDTQTPAVNQQPAIDEPVSVSPTEGGALPLPDAPAESLVETAVVPPEGITTAGVDLQPAAAPEVDLDAEAEARAASAEEEAALAMLMGSDAADRAEAAMGEYKLNFYGFADFSVQRFLFDSADGYPPSFSIGRLNLYFGGELGDNWRTLTEVRFSYLPNGSTAAGSDLFAPPVLTNTTVPDYVDYDRPRRYGSIILERAWIEKTFETWLTIQAGHYLTPYGIWNVDHGSPVILGVTRPYAVGESLFPESQTGFLVHGSEAIGPANVGYVLTLSNGRGPFDTTRDLDENKAVGWRLRGSYDTDMGLFSLGYSGYLGDYTEGAPTWTLNPDGTFTASIRQDVNYGELGTAFDFKWELGGASLQSEFIMQQVQQKTPQVRYVDATPFSPAGLLPDYRRLGIYGIAAYRFDSLLGLTPWIGTEYYDSGRQPGSFFPRGVYELYLGLNLRPTPRVVLKTQYVGVYAKDIERIDILNGQVAWSF